jgi:hypothetical protein
VDSSDSAQGEVQVVVKIMVKFGFHFSSDSKQALGIQLFKG